MKKTLLFLLFAVIITAGMAQRKMDILNRGLVAVKTTGGVFVSWRITGEEYYDVTYNLYRDGVKINDIPLSVSNYKDAGGNASSQYTVSAVVRGVEQARCKAVTPWEKQYLELPLGEIYSRGGTDITSWYEPNDASVADLDGDGEMEILLKRLNTKDAGDLFPVSNDSAYDCMEAYKLDGTKLWSIDCGPNMVSGGSVELNIVAFDWDEDGKAEVLLRGADGMIIRYNGGERVMGSLTVNTRNTISHTANMTYTNSGAEYLIYMNGETGEPYQVLAYPLARGNAGDWGDGYGHRSSKYFFGAPYLDGRKPSIFLARGIYTKHIMKAFDVDGTTHSLKERWSWSDPGGAWFGQGFHNYGIADVDWDGRDEIVYGNLVVDDNGKGLHTTGLGHGDAQHCSDLDPYRHGQEIFVCGETSPGCSYRDGTTGKIYYRYIAERDDGRAIAGNFTDKFPGSIAFSARSSVISCVTDQILTGGTKDGTDENFRIYWDGDLCEETFNYSTCVNYLGSDPRIVKYGSWNAVTTFTGTYTNNATKGTATSQADILGDWREEVILRDQSNRKLRIYTTTIATPWRNYTLWHDMQYRQGMVWEICGYNQPPHTSYFLGEAEGITVAPPPFTMNGRTEVVNHAIIDANLNDRHIILCETNDMSVTVADGAAPYITTINVPTWVQGSTNNNNITTTTYTCTLTGGAFSGNMRLVKQGDGILTLPAVTETYTGETNIWAGTLNFDGVMQNSPVWLNRFAELNSNGGTFGKGIRMEYASILRPGGADTKGIVTVDSLQMAFGSRIIFDLYSEGVSSDCLKAGFLKIEKKEWADGPIYSTPVVELVPHFLTGETVLAAGKYLIAEIGSVEGSIGDFAVEGLAKQKRYISYEKGKLYLVVESLRDTESIVWTGAVSDIWDFAVTENFVSKSTGEPQIFVPGDNVFFNDDATRLSVSLNGDLPADTIMIDNTKAYTFSGNGAVTGNARLMKQGEGMLTISNDNTYTGGTRISGGTVKVSSLSNQYAAAGNLGGVTTTSDKFIVENGAVLQTSSAVQMGSPVKLAGDEGGVLNNYADFVMDKPFSGTLLTKRGAGTLTMNASNSLNKLVITAGTVVMGGDYMPASTVEFQGGTLQDCDDAGSYSSSSFKVTVPAGKSAVWRLDSRCQYKNTLTGAGTLNVYIPWYRIYLEGNWSAFTGTVKATVSGDNSFPFNNSYGLPNATLDLSSGCYVANGGKSFTIGKITGTGTLGGLSPNIKSGTNTWKVGNSENYKWEGKVTGTGTAFSKVGSGKLTLTAAHDFTGAARVEEGELHINSGTLLGKGVLTVDAGATFSGTTSASVPLTNSSVNINGTLQVGVTSTSVLGSIDFGNKNVTFGKGSVYKVGIRRCAELNSDGGTSITGVNRLTMNGTVAPYLYKSYVPVQGDSIRIWTASDFNGTPEFELPALPQGYGWNTDRINEGLLFITYDPSGIETLEADEKVEVQITTIDGLSLESFVAPYSEAVTVFRRTALPKGIYVLYFRGERGSTVKKVVK